MASKQELVAYVPVIHRGYIDLFERRQGQVDSLWVMGQGLVGQLVNYREIRAVPAELVAVMAESLGYFERVEVLEEEGIGRLADRQILMPDEDVSRRFAGKYLEEGKVSFEPVFLRWNEENVASPQTVRPDRESRDDFDQKMMELAQEEAKKSSDWWRRIGAVVVKDGKVVLAAHNQHEPTEQTPYVDGDPRDVIEAGTHNLLYSSIHAEQLVVAEAAGRGIDLAGASLYINVFPCPMCVRIVAHTGMRRCFFKTGSAWLNSEEVMRSRGVETVRVLD